jgi:GT2 family glycosyltransferase
MEQSELQVAIVIPTLDREKGTEVAEKMAKAAGIPTLVLVATDQGQEGSTKAGNIGLTTAYEAGATHICYVNDDVWFEQIGWLKRLVEALDSNPEYGIAGPGIKCVTLPQLLGKPGLKPGIIPAKMLTFSCAVIKREVFENIGFLDETFIHFGSDTDFCMRARQAGYRLVWVRDVYAFHDYKLVTERSEQEREWKIKDEQTYRKLWGDFEYRLKEG